MRPAFPPERPDRSRPFGIFDGMDSVPIPGSFSEYFEDAEEVDGDDLPEGYYWAEKESAVRPDNPDAEMQSGLSDAEIDAALDRAEALLAEVNQAYEDLPPSPECTCTVVPYTGRLSESKPAEIEARFEKTHAEICNHCLSQLTA